MKLFNRCSTLKPYKRTYENEESLVVKINVRGVRFKVFWNTIKELPGLSKTILEKGLHNRTKNEYFFDRDPEVFKCLLNLCRLGEMHIPNTICGPLFNREIQEWGIIIENKVEFCCLMNLTNSMMRIKNLRNFEKFFYKTSDAATHSIKCVSHFRQMIWKVLEHPTSSALALIYSAILYLAVMGFLFVFVVSSVNSVPFAYQKLEVKRNVTTLTYVKADYLQIIYYITVSILTFDLVTRTIFCDNLRTHVCSCYTIIDILSLIPFYYNLIASYIEKQTLLFNFPTAETSDVIRVLGITSVLRFFRILRQYRGLQVLLYTMKVSANDLILMMVFVMVAMLVFSSVIFYVEGEVPDSHFTNIPKSFWWCIVTITTTGYGDMVPKTPFGFLVAGICSLCGVLLIAFTVPILVNNFVLFYTHAAMSSDQTITNYAYNQLGGHIKKALGKVKNMRKKSKRARSTNQKRYISSSENVTVFTIMEGNESVKMNKTCATNGQNCAPIDNIQYF